MERHQRWILPLVAGAALLAAWQGIIVAFRLEPFVLPSPGDVAAALRREWPLLGPAAARTFASATIGFASAVVGGVLLAVLLAAARPVRLALAPLVLVLQMTPIVVLAPILVIWLGDGLPSITAITFLIGFFPVVANTLAGLLATDTGLRDLFRMGNATPAQELLLLRLPAALPYFLAGVKIAGTLAPIGAIVGDFLAGSADRHAGLGFLVGMYRSQVKVDAVFALALVACVLGFLFVGAVNLLHWKLLHAWHDAYSRRDS